MEAPSYICRKVAEEHKWARIGWMGRDRLPGEFEVMNPGQFALVQLYHTRDYGREGELTFREPWKKQWPIQGKDGGRPDWDPLTRHPVVVATLSKEDVFSGKIIAMVREMSKSIVKRIYEANLTLGRELDCRVQDMCDDIGDRIYKEGQRDGSGAPIVAKKFIKPSLNKLKYEAGELDFKKDFLPPPPPGGWDKHLNK